MAFGIKNYGDQCLQNMPPNKMALIEDDIANNSTLFPQVFDQNNRKKDKSNNKPVYLTWN